MAPNETDWETRIIKDDTSDSDARIIKDVTDVIPTKESAENVTKAGDTKSIKDEITEDKPSGSAPAEAGFFYPWESPVCEDVHAEEHCSKFKENFR